MQIVIEIDEKVYKAIKEGFFLGGRKVGKSLLSQIFHAIANGKPLPKGHGKLKDVSNFTTITDIRTDGSEYTYVSYDEIESAPIIIEADREVEDG